MIDPVGLRQMLAPDSLWRIETRTKRSERPLVRKARRQLARNGGYYRQRWLLGAEPK